MGLSDIWDDREKKMREDEVDTRKIERKTNFTNQTFRPLIPFYIGVAAGTVLGLGLSFYI